MFFRGFLRFSVISRVIANNSQKVLQKRCLHLSQVCLAKKYSSTEGVFAERFIQSYTATKCKQKQTFIFEENLDGKSTEEIVDAFEALSFHCEETQTDISNETFNSFFEQFVPQVVNFSDEQLVKVLADCQRLPPTEHTKSKNFFELRIALDEACCERLKDWKTPQILKVCHHWYKLHLGKIGTFSWKGVIKISRRFRKLTSKELVETMFYVSICRTRLCDMIDAEMRMLELIDEFNIDEIGIISLAFFKTESKMKTRELIDKIYDKTIEAAADIHEVTIASIMKNLRYSSDPSHTPKMPLLSEALLPHTDKYHMLALLHIGLLGTNLQYCNQALFEKILKQFNENVSQTRLKDIDRIAFATGLFDFKTESGVEQELLRKILEELKTRKKEIMTFPKCFVATAHYLSIMGVHDDDIINSILNEQFVEFAYGENHQKIGRELLCLDSYTRINLLSTYKGCRLSKKLRTAIAKYQTKFVPDKTGRFKVTHADKLMLNIQNVFEEQFGISEIRHVLPHYERADIVFCFNENGNPVTEEIRDLFPPHYKGEIVSKEFLFEKEPALMDKYKMVAIVVGGWNYFVRGSEKPTGGLRLKLEQLEMIGYKPILIHFNNWITMSSKEKTAYVTKEMKNALK